MLVMKKLFLGIMRDMIKFGALLLINTQWLQHILFHHLQNDPCTTYYVQYYIQNEWSHSLFLNKVQAHKNHYTNKRQQKYLTFFQHYKFHKTIDQCIASISPFYKIQILFF